MGPGCTYALVGLFAFFAIGDAAMLYHEFRGVSAESLTGFHLSYSLVALPLNLGACIGLAGRRTWGWVASLASVLHALAISVVSLVGVQQLELATVVACLGLVALLAAVPLALLNTSAVREHVGPLPVRWYAPVDLHTKGLAAAGCGLVFAALVVSLAS